MRSWIVKPNSETMQQSLMLGKQFTLHSKRNVYVYSISAILCSGVAGNTIENRGNQRRALQRIINIHKSRSYQLDCLSFPS